MLSICMSVCDRTVVRIFLASRQLKMDRIGGNVNKSAKWHCGRHTLICKKYLLKKLD